MADYISAIFQIQPFRIAEEYFLMPETLSRFPGFSSLDDWSHASYDWKDFANIGIG